MSDRPSSSVTAAEILDQAQVYACTWSSVDGPFDAGDTLQRALEEKAELSRLVQRLAFERDGYRDSMQELADRLEPGKGVVIGIKESQYPQHLKNPTEA